jgi:hypothetical protein
MKRSKFSTKALMSAGGDEHPRARPCFLRSLRNRRLAAFLSRRLWTRISRTSPFWSTARQSQCFFLAIVMTTSSRCHLSPRQGALTDAVGEYPPEFEAPLPDRLVGYRDAAGGQHLLDHAQAQREAKIQSYRVADDLSRIPMAGVNRVSRRRHPARLPDQAAFYQARSRPT